MTFRNFLRSFLALALMAFVALAATSANAEIIVDATDYWTGGSNPVSGNFNASGSDKLVVIVTGEHGFNQTGNGSISGITYDGVEMTELINRTTIKASADPVVLVDDTWNAIYYLDDPGTVYTAGLISATVSSRGSMTVFGLSGTAAGAGNSVIGDRDTSTVDLTTSADSIVIASYGMGGTGNTAYINNVTVDAPLTFVSKQNNGGGRWWDGHVTSYANGVAAGTATYSVTDTSAPGADGRTGAHLIAAEFLLGAPPALLTLQVNTITGGMALLGDTAEAIEEIKYYEITSEGDSLDDVNWVSLTDQDFEGSGPPNGTGDGWEKAGGIGSHALAEGFLLGSSTFDASSSISLGMGYDEGTDSQDLVFTYSNEAGKVFEGVVQYVSCNPDIDGNGTVDSTDLSLVLSDYDPLATGCDGLAPYSPADLELLLDNFGRTDLAITSTAEVPEPTSMVLLLLGMAGLLVRRRRK